MTEETLASLAAKESIRRLVSLYCDAVARRDADAIGALFAPDARVRIVDQPERVGIEAIVEGFRQTLAAFAFLHQRCDTGLIDIDGNRATARLGVFETNRMTGSDRLGIFYGAYQDDYVRLDAGWRFHRRRFSLKQRLSVAVADLDDFPDLIPDRAYAP